MTYGEKLKSPKWQKKRLEILERDKFTCTMCGSKEKQLHVHHKVYIFDKDPWDYEDQFYITFCEDCHFQEECNKSFIKNIIKYNVYKGVTYTELRPLFENVLSKYVKEKGMTFDELQNFCKNGKKIY